MVQFTLPKGSSPKKGKTWPVETPNGRKPKRSKEPPAASRICPSSGTATEERRDFHADEECHDLGRRVPFL